MKNGDDLSDIATRCQRVAAIIRKAAENDKLQDNGDLMKATLSLREYVPSTPNVIAWTYSFTSIVQVMQADIEKRHNRKTWRKMISIHDDTRKIEEFKETLRDFLVEFQVRNSLHVSPLLR